MQQTKPLNKITSVTDTSSADCVIGLSFGFQLDKTGAIQPGSVNDQLASYIARNFAGKPCILQHEIADALESLHHVKAAATIASLPGVYLDSRQVLLQVKTFMAAQRLKKVVIVAQAHHARRVSALCKRMGIQAIVPDDLPELWDSHSAQWWVRSHNLWNLREPTVIAHHKLKRWI
jgi:hypothetical protein